MIIESFEGTCTSKNIADLAEKIVDHGRRVPYKKACKLVNEFFEEIVFDPNLRNPWSHETKKYKNYLNITHSGINHIFKVCQQEQ